MFCQLLWKHQQFTSKSDNRHWKNDRSLMEDAARGLEAVPTVALLLGKEYLSLERNVRLTCEAIVVRLPTTVLHPIANSNTDHYAMQTRSRQVIRLPVLLDHSLEALNMEELAFTIVKFLEVSIMCLHTSARANC
jgi:hypothetical protein